MWIVYRNGQEIAAAYHLANIAKYASDPNCRIIFTK